MAPDTEVSARQTIRDYLIRFGLDPGMADQVWDKAIQSDFYGMPGYEDAWNNDVYQAIRATPQYKAAYPVIDQLNASGRPITEGDYLAYTRDVQAKVKQYGLPAGVFDTPDFIGRMLLNDVSAGEADRRIAQASSVVYSMPQSVKDAFIGQGASNGDLIAAWLNPDDALPVIEQKLAKAQVTGAANEQGVGITADQAANLAARGVGYDDARQGFARVSSMGGLSAGLGQAETIGQPGLTDAVFGDAGAAQKAERVQDSRRKRFTGQGGAAASNQGVSGLGSR